AGRVASPALLELHAAKRTTTKRSVRIRSKAQCAPRARVTETSRPHDDLHLERVPDDDVFAFGRADELSLIVAEALRDDDRSGPQVEHVSVERADDAVRAKIGALARREAR